MARMFAANGAKVAIGPAMAFNDSADLTSSSFPTSGGQAIAWTDIGGIQSIGQFGDTAAAIEVTHLSSSRTRKMKGARDAGGLTIVASADYADAGQIALVAAEKTKESYAFRVTFNDAPSGSGTPSLRYFVGFVMSAAEEVGEANTVLTLNAEVAIDSNIVRVPAAA